MKFANIDKNSFGIRKELEKEEQICLNFGDHIQAEAIDQLYRHMGIPEEDIVKISYYDLQTYDGEPVILPLNMVFVLYMSEHGKLFSPKITPVFLGIHVFCELPSFMVKEFKKWQPIGCRDEYTYQLLKKQGLDCYLAGCLSITLPKRAISPEQKQIFCIDVPEKIISYIPKDIKDKAIMSSNAFIGTLSSLGCTPEQYMKNFYMELVNTASLVVTSRLHIAAPCIAMGIPVVFCSEKMSPTYSWLEKYIPIYLENHFSRIDWNPKPVAMDKIKEKLLNMNVARLREVYEKKNFEYMAKEITDFYLERERIPINLSINFENIIRHAVEIKGKEAFTKYSIWGITPASVFIHELLQKLCKGSQLVAVYDIQKEGEFLGKKIQKPEEMKVHREETMCIVSAFGASTMALELFQKLHLQENEYCIMGIEYVLALGRDREF